MDGDQFDQLTRHFGLRATRRAVVGVVAGLVPTLEVWAKKRHHTKSEKKKKGKGKGKGKRRCGECQRRVKG